MLIIVQEIWLMHRKSGSKLGQTDNSWLFHDRMPHQLLVPEETMTSITFSHCNKNKSGKNSA